MPAPVSPAEPADRATTTPTEPELHLRLVGERTLIAREDHDRHGLWGQGDLGSAASALVAVGLLPAAVAVDVVDDYQLAAGLRGDRHARTMWGSSPAPPLTGAPAAPVVALCRPATPPPDPPAGDEAWTWDVHFVLLGDTETVLTVSSSSTTLPPWERDQPQLVPGHPFRGQTSTVALADDTGHVEQAEFSGGGGGGEWSGRYTTASPLSPTTRWLELGGRRLYLERPTPPPTVWVEDHGSGGPAERHLRHRLAADELHHGKHDRGPDAAVEALVATGALPADDPVLAELAAVRAARAVGGLLHGGPLRGLPRRYSAFPGATAPSRRRPLDRPCRPSRPSCPSPGLRSSARGRPPGRWGSCRWGLPRRSSRVRRPSSAR